MQAGWEMEPVLGTFSRLFLCVLFAQVPVVYSFHRLI